MTQPSSSGAAWAGALVKPWWERSVPCREASATAHGGCVEQVLHSTECSTDVDPATGEPVKRCVKLYKRYLKCAGRPEQLDEQKQEMMARGEGAQRLEPNLVELPTRLEAGAAGPLSPPSPADASLQMEDVGHAFEEFLRFAEELQEQMVPGVMHLDQAPAMPVRPYSEGEASQQSAAAHQQEVGAGDSPFDLLGRLLFGKRRAAAAEGSSSSSSSSGGRRQHVDASTWKDFEKDITEI